MPLSDEHPLYAQSSSVSQGCSSLLSSELLSSSLSSSPAALHGQCDARRCCAVHQW